MGGGAKMKHYVSSYRVEGADVLVICGRPNASPIQSERV